MNQNTTYTRNGKTFERKSKEVNGDYRATLRMPSSMYIDAKNYAEEMGLSFSSLVRNLIMKELKKKGEK